MVGDYDDRVEQIIRLTEDLFLEKRKQMIGRCYLYDTREYDIR